MAQFIRPQNEDMSELNMDPTKNNLAKYEQSWLCHIRMVQTLHTQKNFFSSDASEVETWAPFKGTRQT
jgi:glycine cleavage system H lipoate-binding protein